MLTQRGGFGRIEDSSALAERLDRAWDRFGAKLPTLAVPTLANHGELDPIAPVSAVRAYAEGIPVRASAIIEAQG